MDIEKLRDFIQDWLKGTGCFLTDLKIGEGNSIQVEIDSEQSIDIDKCVALTRAIEEAFPRDDEDYDLEVGSAGLTSPLKVPAQFRKHLGHDMEVLTKNGRKLHGELTSADEEGFELKWEQKTKVEGQKKPVMEVISERFLYPDVKKVTYDLKF